MTDYLLKVLVINSQCIPIPDFTNIYVFSVLATLSLWNLNAQCTWGFCKGFPQCLFFALFPTLPQLSPLVATVYTFLYQWTLIFFFSMWKRIVITAYMTSPSVLKRVAITANWTSLLWSPVEEDFSSVHELHGIEKPWQQYLEFDPAPPSEADWENASLLTKPIPLTLTGAQHF